MEDRSLLVILSNLGKLNSPHVYNFITLIFVHPFHDSCRGSPHYAISIDKHSRRIIIIND